MGRRSDPRWRDEAAAGLMASAVPELGLDPPVLLVDDPRPEVEKALQDSGLPVVRWSRLHRPGGPPGESWPPPGPFGAALIRLPRSRDALDFALHASCAALRPGGRVMVYGANDEGISSTPRRLEALLGPVPVRANARRCRVLEGTWLGAGSGDALRGSLEAWRRVAAVDLGWGDVPWVSYPGTFAAGGLDDGTALLLEHLPTVEAGDAVVDFGAGTGVLAAAVAHRAPGARICLVEPDAPSREAAGENVPGGEFLPVSGWEEHGPFQMVVSNPPYHDGKAETLDVVRALVAGSARGLVERGELRLVVQRRLPVEGILASSFRVVEGVADRGPHRVWRAADPHPRI